jgi:carbamoyltransferase
MHAPRFVLGISALFHDSAAALVDGATIVAAAQEERFSRRKADSAFPGRAIEYCLSQLPAGAGLDAVAFYENPRLKMDRIVETAVANAPRGAVIWPQALRTLFELDTSLPARLCGVLDDPSRIHFTTHHRSHAASAFYPSPFDSAAVLVVDGVGEWSTTSIWQGSGDRLHPVREVRFPHSLGLFYSAFTQYCGFKVNSGEYKLMGLAPFGRPVYRKKICDEIIDVKPDGSFALNLKYFEFHTGASTVSPLFGILLGQPVRLPSEPLTQHFMDVAASAQAVINDVMQALAVSALRLTDMRHLCMAGGVALNCVANTAIWRNVTGLNGLWIQPAASDAGGALGAALEVARRGLPSRPIRPVSRGDAMNGALLGPRYSYAEIEAVLRHRGIPFEAPVDEGSLCQAAAAALGNGSIVGHFDGRMEFGPRALGNRSILADPRPDGTLQRVNRQIKFREGWRPFAPVVLAEEAAHYFDGPTDSPYMLLLSELKEQFRSGPSLGEARSIGTYLPADLQQAVTSAFGAISHVDYTSRLQTLSRHSGSRVGAILAAFHELTGCPMLLNTSFNVRGEPIVCSPDDAVGCFLDTHLDVLVIGPFIVRKQAGAAWMNKKAGRRKFDAD